MGMTPHLYRPPAGLHLGPPLGEEGEEQPEEFDNSETTSNHQFSPTRTIGVALVACSSKNP
jgi:hypothetical protein